MRTTLGVQHWQLEGRIGGRDVLIRVDQPPDRCVSLAYTDPDGGTAVCTNTEQADIHIEIGDDAHSFTLSEVPLVIGMLLCKLVQYRGRHFVFICERLLMMLSLMPSARWRRRTAPSTSW